MRNIVTEEAKRRIVKLYCAGTLLSEIADQFAICVQTVENVLNAAGVERCRKMRRKYDYDLVCSLYKEGKTVREVAAEIGANHRRVADIVKQAGISRTKRTRKWVLESRAKSCGELQPGFVSYLDGLLISDGHLTVASANTKTSCYSQSCVFREWLELICNRLGEAGIVSQVNKDIRDGKLKGYYLYSNRYSELFHQQRRWYREDGEKTVPQDLNFTPEFLLNWVYGDGTLVNTQLRLCTDSFSEADVDWLVFRLNEEFGLRFRKTYMGLSKLGRSKWRPSICKRDGLLEFYKIIGLPSIDCFRYKWLPEVLK